MIEGVETVDRVARVGEANVLRFEGVSYRLGRLVL